MNDNPPSRIEFECELDEIAVCNEIILWAEAGDTRPLEEYLNSGEPIGRMIRDFLVRYLRGEIPKRPGNKLTRAQKIEAIGTATEVWQIALSQVCSMYEARQIYLDQNPMMNSETLKSIIQNS